MSVNGQNPATTACDVCGPLYMYNAKKLDLSKLVCPKRRHPLLLLMLLRKRSESNPSTSYIKALYALYVAKIAIITQKPKWLMGFPQSKLSSLQSD